MYKSPRPPHGLPSPTSSRDPCSNTVDVLVSQPSPMTITYCPKDFRMHRKRRYEEDSSEDEQFCSYKKPTKSLKKAPEILYEPKKSACTPWPGESDSTYDTKPATDGLQRPPSPFPMLAEQSISLDISPQDSVLNKGIGIDEPIEVDEDEDDSMELLMELWQKHKVSRQMRIEASRRNWVYRDPTKRISGICCRCGALKAFIRKAAAGQDRSQSKLECDGCSHAKCTACIINRPSRSRDSGNIPGEAEDDKHTRADEDLGIRVRLWHSQGGR